LNELVFTLSGIVHIILTPRPWGISPEYSFLTIAAVLHWLFLLPTVIGGGMLWRQSKEAALLIIYCLVLIVLYGSYAELQGPRHRLQLVFIIAWMQFHFFWHIISTYRNRSKIGVRV